MPIPAPHPDNEHFSLKGLAMGQAQELMRRCPDIFVHFGDKDYEKVGSSRGSQTIHKVTFADQLTGKPIRGLLFEPTFIALTSAIERMAKSPDSLLHEEEAALEMAGKIIASQAATTGVHKGEISATLSASRISEEQRSERRTAVNMMDELSGWYNDFYDVAETISRQINPPDAGRSRSGRR